MSYIYFSAGKDGYFNYRRVPTQKDAEEWHNINFTDKVYRPQDAWHVYLPGSLAHEGRERRTGCVRASRLRA